MLLSEKKKNTKVGLLFKIKVAAALTFCALVCTIFDALNSGPPFAFNDGETKTRTDVATLPLVDFYSC